jgi:hypothetical protein
VENHFTVTTRVASVNINAKYDDSLPAAPFVEASAFAAGPHVEADRPVRLKKVFFGRLARPEGRWKYTRRPPGAWRQEPTSLTAHLVISILSLSHGHVVLLIVAAR